MKRSLETLKLDHPLAVQFGISGGELWRRLSTGFGDQASPSEQLEFREDIQDWFDRMRGGGVEPRNGKKSPLRPVEKVIQTIIRANYLVIAPLV